MLRFVAAFFALAAAALAATSYAFEKEGQYKVTFTGGSIAFGILRSCAEVGSTTSCQWLEGEEVTIANKCTRDKATVSARVYSMMSLGPFGGFLALIGVVASIPNSRGAGIARLLIMALSFLSIGVCCGLFYMLVTWIYCDEKVCDVIGASNCEESFTLYFWLHVGACGSALLGTVVAAPALAQSEAPPPADAGNAPSADATNEPRSQEGAEDGATQQAKGAEGSDEAKPAATKEPETGEPAQADAEAAKPAEGDETADGECDEAADGEDGAEAADGEAGEDEDGDWVWDEESGMYWSESAYMYLEPESGMYYDPNSGWWYDPESEQWIEPEEEEATE